MTDDELKNLVASLAIAQKETDKQFHEQQKETDKQLKETDKQFREQQKETRKYQKETDKQLKELGKQLGGLGHKFGGFTEGMAFPSMTKILKDTFLVDQLLQSLKNFHYFFPEHSDKTVQGILASVDTPEQVKKYALNKGFIGQVFMTNSLSWKHLIILCLSAYQQVKL